MAGARHTGAGQHRLHLRLVPDVGRDVGGHPLDAQRVPGLGERHLELLEGADQPLDVADLPGESAHRVDDLLRVQGIGHLPVTGERLPQLRGQLLGGGGGDHGQPHARHPGRRQDEPGGGFEQVRCDESGDDHGRETTGTAPGIARAGMQESPHA